MLDRDKRIHILHLAPHRSDFAVEVRRGLAATPKNLNASYFYDELGACLFEAIARLPEYYIARAEAEILETYSNEILDNVGRQVRLAELGSGSGLKTRQLIKSILRRQDTLEYIAIDIDAASLTGMANALAYEFENLHITGLVTTFEEGVVQLANLVRKPGFTTLVLFLGSTIGNLTPNESQRLLQLMRASIRRGDGLLVGADSVKRESALIAAYNDALGITAAFNRNILLRINRELHGTIDLDDFCHFVRYDSVLERIEMHLVSRRAHDVVIDGREFAFASGEMIHTESSYKFTKEKIERVAENAGFRFVNMWTDSNEYYADYLVVADRHK